jgi:hypothetical protein
MAEVVLNSETNNDGSLIAEPQESAYTERNRSIVDLLPTAEYRILDAGPIPEPTTIYVSR